MSTLPAIINDRAKVVVEKKSRKFLPDLWEWNLLAIRYGTTVSATDWAKVDQSKQPPPFEARGTTRSKVEALRCAEKALRDRLELEKDERREAFSWSQEMSGRWSWHRP